MSISRRVNRFNYYALICSYLLREDEQRCLLFRDIGSFLLPHQIRVPSLYFRRNVGSYMEIVGDEFCDERLRQA